ncbi:polysaccharide deacetylase family protein [Alkalimarinus sediminis]|uniref:Polysaccharide deacetylase family protein n=1 Tax=Alkalimarinus sediminis TaxID=1632866 RepID=A0A9E8HL64_9ALTE|nr:polysaccharide deacetylase family protein [Alkalimarinus sediminis]UZW76157.1 polysaccharide deacetylase family protein [Alkalimarinus sediminis]
MLNKIERKLVAISNHKKKLINLNEPVVSFTFDDFPKTSLINAGNLLYKHGIRGTYYLSSGLIGKFNDGLHICDESDILHAVRQGHEIGCHTFEHLDCQKASLETLEKSLVKNSSLIENLTGYIPTSFSYPFGRISFNSRKLVSSRFNSARGIGKGVNYNVCDLSNLKANPIYFHSFDLNYYESLVKQAVKNKGWLILYTHDVSDDPSKYGCTPDELEKIVDLVQSHNITSLTVNEAMLKLLG